MISARKACKIGVDEKGWKNMANAKFKRRSEIVKIVREKKQMSCVELSKTFGVTEETIRKDLQELSEKGELLRTFGGAMVREYGTERSLDQRIIQNLEQKKRIAQKAVSTLKSGDLVAMDAGSTVTMMAKAIPDHLKITVLTNSLEICNILSEKENVTVICTGGKLHKKSMSLQGMLTESTINSLNAEKAFISCAAFDIKLGVMDSNEEAARTKQSMIRNAREVYLLMDSSKIGCIAYITTCPASSITKVVTDNAAAAEVVKRIEDLGIEMILA